MKVFLKTSKGLVPAEGIPCSNGDTIEIRGDARTGSKFVTGKNIKWFRADGRTSTHPKKKVK